MKGKNFLSEKILVEYDFITYGYAICSPEGDIISIEFCKNFKKDYYYVSPTK